MRGPVRHYQVPQYPAMRIRPSLSSIAISALPFNRFDRIPTCDGRTDTQP